MNSTLPCRPLAWAAILLLAGCASPPRPDAQFAVSRSAIEEALGAGATQSAPLELQHARDKMARADAAVDAKNFEDARRLAEEAEVDARLAAAKARTARAQLAVAEIQKSIRALRENVNTDSAQPLNREAP
ncbi:MAG TPA: DUF4398 domain-containing protein [Rhodocyclaceae bacterium]|nr:DUF4398 domain-containing protein [Rhodocyclaceae bacterium]